MKKYAFHLVYLLIISILSYQLWSKTTADAQAFEQVERVLANDYHSSNQSAQYYETTINKNVQAYYTSMNIVYLKKVEKMRDVSDKTIHWIDKKLLAIKESKTVDIAEINDSTRDFKQLLVNQDLNNGMYEAEKKLALPQNINNDTLTQAIEKRPSLYLHILKNLIQNDVIAYSKFIMMETTSRSIEFNTFKVAIAPRQASLVIGETFETDVYVTKYAINTGSNQIRLLHNNTDLPTKDGVAHYSKKERTLGKKVFKAKAIITNPMTGQIITSEGLFEYNVVPKCCYDCH